MCWLTQLDYNHQQLHHQTKNNNYKTNIFYLSKGMF